MNSETYFKHVDYIVDKAESLGLFIGMLPTWGSYWSSNQSSRNIFTPENACVYGPLNITTNLEYTTE